MKVELLEASLHLVPQIKRGIEFLKKEGVLSSTTKTTDRIHKLSSKKCLKYGFHSYNQAERAIIRKFWREYYGHFLPLFPRYPGSVR